MENLTKRYRLVDRIFSSKLSNVYFAKHIITDVDVAVKITDKKNMTVDDMKLYVNEVKCLKFAQHQNVMQLYEIIEDDHLMIMISEYCKGGTLDSWFNKKYKRNGMSEKLASLFIYQILEALEFIHSINLVHLDLKPQNILLYDDESIIKLCDFGFSQICCKGEKIKRFCGTFPYIAPEIISQNSYLPEKSDVWSLGMVMYYLLCGFTPYEEFPSYEMTLKIMSDEIFYPDNLSDDCKRLLKASLEKSPKERITLSDFKKSSWFDHVPDTLSHCKSITINDELHNGIMQTLIQNHQLTSNEITKALMEKTYDEIYSLYFFVARNTIDKTGQIYLNYFINLTTQTIVNFEKSSNSPQDAFGENVTFTEDAKKNLKMYFPKRLSLKETSLWRSMSDNNLLSPKTPVFKMRSSTSVQNLQLVDDSTDDYVLVKGSPYREQIAIEKSGENRNKLDSDPSLKSLDELTE